MSTLAGSRRGMAISALAYLLLTVLAACYLVPFIWIALASVKPTDLIMAYPPRFAFQPTEEHFITLFTTWRFAPKLTNTIILATAATAINLLVASPAAFALARLKMRHRETIAMWILAHRFLPPVLVLLPLFLLYRAVGLLDTVAGIVIASLTPTVPFSIWLLRGFFEDIPSDLDDSARVDGCNDFQILWLVVLPIARPALAVAGLFTFLFSWNDFLIPLALARTRAATVTLAFSAFQQDYFVDWGSMAAAGVVCVLPLFLVVLFFSSHIISGLTLGAVKD